MTRDRQSAPLKALARVANVLRSSRTDKTNLRRALDAARIAGVEGLAITEGHGSPIAAVPDGFAPSSDPRDRFVTPLHRGHLEAAGPDLRTEPFPSYLEALANLVSQAMAAQERIDRTRHEFRSLFGSFPAAVAMQRHGLVNVANNAWNVLTGGVTVGQSVVGWILEEDRDRAARAIERVLPEPVEVRLAYDPSRWVELEATTQMAFDGQQAGLVVVREITDQRANQARRAIQDRLETMRFVTSGIAHELENPLTALTANLDVARRRTEPAREPWAAELLTDLGDAAEASELLQHMVHDLRALGQTPGGEAGHVDVRRVVDLAVGLTRSHLGHRCHVERHYDDVPPVVGRADGLGQVVLALLQNAADAFARRDAQSDVPVDARPAHTLQIWIRSRTGEVLIEVADDGPGVPSEMRGGLFEPFVGYGTGLGLTLAREIVESLGGSLSWDDRSGQGSLFRVRLPIAQVPRIPRAPEPAVEVLGRVLVVDDEPMIGRFVTRVLAPDYEIVIAPTGAEGLARVRENPDLDLILLDLMMPGMSGMGFYEELEQQLPHLLGRVVVVTGGVYTESAHDFLQRTGCATLRKPFDKADLVRALDERRVS